MTTQAARVAIRGRDQEAAAVDAFVAGAAGLRTLLLTGTPGIGKTTLWETGVDAARERGLRVLTARPSGVEARLSFGSLIDLCDGVAAEAVANLPGPQRSALEVALLRAEPAGARPEQQAIALGFLGLLRALADEGPLIVAIDDLQWLDDRSAGTLTFAARRLEDEPVRFLLARRPTRRSELERTLERAPLERLTVSPLGLEETRGLLADRLGLSLPRPLLRRIVESTLGNPLFALEMGRALAEGGLPEPGDDIPLPGAVEEMLGTRVAVLPDPVRRLLLAVALGGELRTGEVAAVAEPGALDDAVDAGVVHVDPHAVRASHPLLAAAAKKRSPRREQRELHRALAGAVGDDELRAYHLALAADRPDAELAATVAAAAAAASARGAAEEAVQLGEHALRLTPGDGGERSERLLTLAGYMDVAGQRQRVNDLVRPELDSLPPGAARVRAWLLLAEGGAVWSYANHQEHLQRALAEAGDDPALRAQVLAMRAINTAAEGVERIREAEKWALEALPAESGAEPELERLALSGLGWIRSLRGLPIDDVCERFRGASDAAFRIIDSPEPVAGLRYTWRGEIDEARAVFEHFLALADERGEAVGYAWLRLNMCELELRTGEWDALAARLDEWAEGADGKLLITPTYQRCRALMAAGRGYGDEAQRWATPALAEARSRGYSWQVLESSRALGVAALLAGRPARAAEHLRRVWDHTVDQGIDEPGAFPVAPDLVEALVAQGELDEARAVADRLHELAEAQEHPWGRASAKRCAAAIRLRAARYDAEAAALMESAAADYAALGLRLDAGRSLLALGRVQRRRRKWGAARTTLDEAIAIFDELGSDGWSEQARSELAHVGGRKPQPPGELTPAERRVAELAASGLSNKEIAAELHVVVNTVELHLSNVYKKLGIRSRAELPPPHGG